MKRLLILVFVSLMVVSCGVLPPPTVTATPTRIRTKTPVSRLVASPASAEYDIFCAVDKVQLTAVIVVNQPAAIGSKFVLHAYLYKGGNESYDQSMEISYTAQELEQISLERSTSILPVGSYKIEVLTWIYGPDKSLISDGNQTYYCDIKPRSFAQGGRQWRLPPRLYLYRSTLLLVSHFLHYLV